VTDFPHRTRVALALIILAAGLIFLANADLVSWVWHRVFVFAATLIVGAALYAGFAHRTRALK
jgi:hypothetical protein